MIIEFEIGNFRSFRDTVTLSMVAVPAFKDHVDSNTFKHHRHPRLLKSVGIYGPNAGGKSNLIKALAFMRRLVKDSAKNMQVEDPIAVEPFRLDVETKQAPCRFELTFLDGSQKFRYGFEVDKKIVQAEWLFLTDYTKQRARERTIFLREANEIDVRDGIVDSAALVSRTRDNALFLSVAAQWNDALASRIVTYFDNLHIFFEFNRILSPLSWTMLKDEKMSAKLILACRAADLGISDLSHNEDHLPESYYEQVPYEFSGLLQNNVLVDHIRYNGDEKDGIEQFDLKKEESKGTKKFFNILGPVLQSLERGTPLVIDELETNLHPLLTQSIVRLFNSEDINSKNAQLIFATHDVNLMSNADLRRDQMWFVEKTSKGASQLLALSEYKVRGDASYTKDYLKGRYGGLPEIEIYDVLRRALRGR